MNGMASEVASRLESMSRVKIDMRVAVSVRHMRVGDQNEAASSNANLEGVGRWVVRVKVCTSMGLDSSMTKH